MSKKDEVEKALAEEAPEPTPAEIPEGIQPDGTGGLPPYDNSFMRAQLDEAREAQRRDMERARAKAEQEPNNRSGMHSQWKTGVRSSYKRDILRVGAMHEDEYVMIVDGRHPKYPNLAFRWVPTNRVDERRRSEGRWQVASLDMCDDIVPMYEKVESGVDKGVGSVIQRNEMVLMYTHRQYVEDRADYIELTTQAQESDVEDAAARRGLRDPRPGHFGMNKLDIYNRRVQERYVRGNAPSMEADPALHRRLASRGKHGS